MATIPKRRRCGRIKCLIVAQLQHERLLAAAVRLTSQRVHVTPGVRFGAEVELPAARDLGAAGTLASCTFAIWGDSLNSHAMHKSLRLAHPAGQYFVGDPKTCTSLPAGFQQTRCMLADYHLSKLRRRTP